MPRGHPYAQSKLIKSLASWSGQHHTNRNNNIRMLSGRISGGITGGNGYVVPSLPPSSTRLAIPKRSLAQTIVSNAINSALNTIFRKQINPQPGKTTDIRTGWSVARSGSTIVVGTSNSKSGRDPGAVFISTDDGLSWTKIVNPNPGTGSAQNFGYSVAISGSTIVVGDPLDNDAGADAGAVFISTNYGESWTKIVNPNPGTGINQKFGYSVAISGLTIVVGAHGDDNNTGAVFISNDRGESWETKIVNPNPGTDTGQQFGYSVAISGSTIVVGAPRDDDAGDNAGAVFISTDRGESWETKKVNPNPGTGSEQRFGESVAISGLTIVVGAPGDDGAGPTNAGAVFISNDRGESWETKIVNPTPGTGIGQNFGYSVAISGSRIVVGAPVDDDAGDNAGAVFISINDGTTWSKRVDLVPNTGILQEFGYSVAISGLTIVVGAPRDNDAGDTAGAVFISINDGVSWTKKVNPAPGTGTGGQRFGASVAISGSTIVVGAPRDDDAGTGAAGAVFISTNSGVSWTKIVNPAPGTGILQEFGRSVAISGSTIVVGAPGDDGAGSYAGAVFISNDRGESWETKIVNPFPGTGTNQEFGRSVAISGLTIVVGAPGDDGAGPTNAGAVFISTNYGVSWGTKIVNPNPGTGIAQRFGDSVAISGSTIVVGAVGDNDAGASTGAVFINN